MESSYRESISRYIVAAMTSILFYLYIFLLDNHTDAKALNVLPQPELYGDKH